MNRRTFDLALAVAILTHPAMGLVKMVARRWGRETQGAQAVVGQAVQVLA